MVVYLRVDALKRGIGLANEIWEINLVSTCEYYCSFCFEEIEIVKSEAMQFWNLGISNFRLKYSLLT